MMPISAKQAEVFKALSQSETGKFLITYLQQVCRHYADIRTLNGASVEGRLEAVGIIESEILKRLQLTNTGTPNHASEFE